MENFTDFDAIKEQISLCLEQGYWRCTTQDVKDKLILFFEEYDYNAKKLGEVLKNSECGKCQIRHPKCLPECVEFNLIIKVWPIQDDVQVCFDLTVGFKTFVIDGSAIVEFLCWTPYRVPK